MREFLDRIEQTLTIPAAEYVPAIGDVFAIIDEARKAIDSQQPVAEVVAGTENFGAVQFSGPIPPKGTKLYTTPPALQEVPIEPVADAGPEFDGSDYMGHYATPEDGVTVTTHDAEPHCRVQQVELTEAQRAMLTSTATHIPATSPSTTQQPSVAAHALNTTGVVDHATQQQEAGSERPLFDPNFPREGYVSDAEWAARKRAASSDTGDQRPRAVLDVVLRWLEPDGIDSGAAMIEICGLVDPLYAAPSTPAREEALRLAGAAGLDPDPEVVGGSPLGPGEDEYLSWVKLMERKAGVPACSTCDGRGEVPAVEYADSMNAYPSADTCPDCKGSGNAGVPGTSNDQQEQPR